MPITPGTSKTICEYCGNWHYCQRVRKPRQLRDGSWCYPFLLLCQFCQYSVETIAANVLLPISEGEK